MARNASKYLDLVITNPILTNEYKDKGGGANWYRTRACYILRRSGRDAPGGEVRCRLPPTGDWGKRMFSFKSGHISLFYFFDISPGNLGIFLGNFFLL